MKLKNEDYEDFGELVLAYQEAKEQHKESDLIQQLNLSEFMVRLLEDQVALGNACGDFNELQEKGIDNISTLEEYLKEQGFDEADIEIAKENYEVDRIVKKLRRR